MLSNIRTSKSNKELVTKLTQKLNLGAENIIARLAFSYSMSQNGDMKLGEIADSNGKEYSAKVLFGNYEEIYVALIAVKYTINSSDKNIAKYIKMHIDHGLELLDKALRDNIRITGNEFLINEIENALN